MRRNPHGTRHRGRISGRTGRCRGIRHRCGTRHRRGSRLATGGSSMRTHDPSVSRSVSKHAKDLAFAACRSGYPPATLMMPRRTSHQSGCSLKSVKKNRRRPNRRHRRGCGWQTRYRETLPSRTTNARKSERPAKLARSEPYRGTGLPDYRKPAVKRALELPVLEDRTRPRGERGRSRAGRRDATGRSPTRSRSSI
jgi:hypothetical protein